jgi:hypothetical protein
MLGRGTTAISFASNGVTACTGGKGEFTQWVHCEFFVSPETIHLVVTQQVYGGFF